MNTPLKVGLTGGIGSGKTTVLDEFSKLGVPCFVADRVARRYYDDASFVQQIVQRLGIGILNADGTINRQAVAAIVFSDDDKMRWLNSIIHPRVMDDFHQWSVHHAQAPYVLMESAIIYECNLAQALDCIITVYLDREERIRRLLLRDAVTREAIEARMRHQWSGERKLDVADYVILNYEGNPRSRQVETVHQYLLNRALHQKDECQRLS